MEDIYRDLKARFSKIKAVTVNQGKGAQGIKLGAKMFAMFYKGTLVIRLDPGRVVELIQAGEADPFDPGTGKPMKDWAVIPSSRAGTWVRLCEESLRHAISSTR